MKIILPIAFLLLTLKGFAQTPAEAAVIKLSGKVFTWEVENKIDSLYNVFNQNFTAFTSGGQRQVKEQYMATLKGGNVVHNRIDVEESSASVINNTATVGDKGRFIITVNGNQKTIHLSYLEVFIRPDAQSPGVAAQLIVSIYTTNINKSLNSNGL